MLKKQLQRAGNLTFDIRTSILMVDITQWERARERKPVVYGAGLLMMVRGVNGETTGGLLGCEGPMGVQLPWSMARLTGEVRPEKPWKWEISSPLQLEPWPQPETVYCITHQRVVHYLTVNTHEIPKMRIRNCVKLTNKSFLMWLHV